MKILIIDDEKIILDKLKLYVSKLFTSDDIILTSDNANNGLEIIKEKQPDIVLSDIRMPLRSGLDIASFMHQFYPDKIVILITGYSDFKYAQTAIQNHVFDYILKPIDEKVLAASIKKAIRTIDDRNLQIIMRRKYEEYLTGNLENLQKEFLERLLFQNISLESAKFTEELSILKLSHIKMYYFLCCECFSIHGSRSLEKEYYYVHIMEYHIKAKMPDSIIFSYGNILYAICPDVTENHLIKTINILHGELKKHSIQMFAAVSNVSNSLAEIPTLHRQTKDILTNLKSSEHLFLFYRDLEKGPVTDIREKSNYFQDLLNVLSTGNTEMMLSRFEEISKILKKEGIEAYDNFMYSFMTLFLFFFRTSSKDLEDNIYQITENQKNTFAACSDGPEKKKIFTDWMIQVAQIQNSEKANKHNYLAKQILDYIHANYEKPISLYNIADEFHRSTPYISRLIKQNTNKNFIDLLTDLRIEKAKELLKNSALHVNEIANQVGYSNFRYFSRIFKQQTGMTPNDYRKISCRFH